MNNLAAIPNPFAGLTVPSQGGQVDPNNTTVGEILGSLMPYLFSAAALILLVYMVFAGIQLMTSRGDPKGVQGAQAKITTSLIGFIVVFLAYALVKLIGQVFGITIFTQIFQ